MQSVRSSSIKISVLRDVLRSRNLSCKGSSQHDRSNSRDPHMAPEFQQLLLNSYARPISIGLLRQGGEGISSSERSYLLFQLHQFRIR
jgi:hypothetical protein